MTSYQKLKEKIKELENEKQTFRKELDTICVNPKSYEAGKIISKYLLYYRAENALWKGACDTTSQFAGLLNKIK